MAYRVFLYLGGDSYPADGRVEQALRARLGHSALFYGQHELCGRERDFEARKLALRQAIGRFAGDRVTAIGRSSGGRIAAQAATEGAVLTAVVALGYPFRVPGRQEDAERVRPLAALTTPTLILQGRDDPYGSKAEMEGRYAIAPAVSIVELDTGHEFDLAPAGWDAVAALIGRHGDTWL